MYTVRSVRELHHRKVHAARVGVLVDLLEAFCGELWILAGRAASAETELRVLSGTLPILQRNRENAADKSMLDQEIRTARRELASIQREIRAVEAACSRLGQAWAATIRRAARSAEVSGRGLPGGVGTSADRATTSEWHATTPQALGSRLPGP